jgi:hypothetical protein
MVDDDAVRFDLLQRIASRRASVQAHLQEQRPRFRRRANLTIVLSTLAALATAGPAVGGEPFAQGIQRALGLNSDSYVWRVLCLIALLVSVSAAILTNLGKSQDQAVRLANAEAVEAELEGLAVLLEFGQLPVQDAVKLYQQYTSKVSFVPDGAVATGGRAMAAAAPVAGDGARRTSGVPAVPPPARPKPRAGTGEHEHPGPPLPR